MGYEMLNKYVINSADGHYLVNSGLPEFGYELLSTIPYAYHLYKKNQLKSTVSGKDTSCLYWFSDDHKEVNEKRLWSNVKDLFKESFPNIDIHTSQLDWNLFEPPPFKDFYRELAIQFVRPTVVICNRINDEWDGEPINYINERTLEIICELLSPIYDVVYIDPEMFGPDYEDHSPFHKKDVGLILKRYSITTFFDLRNKYPHLSINELQCRLYAGCERFISSNGGLGIFCSYFGGENIIFSKICRELDKDVNSFSAWYPRLSKSIIKVVRNEDDLLRVVKDKWVLNKPLFNIMIRTSGRPNYFHDCIKSIKNQKYSNYNIIVGYDDPDSMKYIQGQPCTAIALERYNEKEPTRPSGDSYGIWFPFNSYFNKLLPYAAKGYVIYLDDDDRFESDDGLAKISEIIEKESADVVFWRVRFPNRIVPCDKNWSKKEPVCLDMSTIGYCHSVSIQPVWEPWKRGDYRVAKYIYDHASNVQWLNEVITGLQRVKQDGYGLRDDKVNIDRTKMPPVVVLITAFNAEDHLERCLDSVINQKQLNNPLKIIVGIDGCYKTFEVAKKLTRKYQSNVTFFFSKNNIGTYVLKNSLLAKIVDRDSLIFFLDSDDLLPSCFLSHYLKKYEVFDADLLQILSLDIKESLIKIAVSCAPNKKLYEEINLFLKKKAIPLATEKIFQLVVQDGSVSVCGLYLSVTRHASYSERLIVEQSVFKPVSRYPHGSFFARYTALEKINYFNKYRVAQDTDLLTRAKKSGLKVVRAQRHATFSFLVRSINEMSLTNCVDLGINSEERNKIIKINENRLKQGLLLGDGVRTPLTIIL